MANPIPMSPDMSPDQVSYFPRPVLSPKLAAPIFTALSAPQKSQLGLDKIPFSPTTIRSVLADGGFCKMRNFKWAASGLQT